MTTDEELLTAWREGDKVAGNTLVHRHFAAVHRVFLGKVPSHKIDDMLQRTFLASVERRDAVYEGSGFRAYVLGIARLQLMRHYREHHRDARSTELDSALLVPQGPTASGAVGLREEQDLLLRALRTLPVDFQLSLELYYWEDLSTVEISRVLDIAPGTVRSRLARAREALADSIAAQPGRDEVRTNTIANLEEWARGLRDALGQLDTPSSVAPTDAVDS